MRKFLSILLLAAFALPLAMSAAALASANSDANLPACCRRNGKHHCAMRMAMMREMLDREPGFHATPSLCPMFPRALAAVHLDFRSFLPLTQTRFSVPDTHPNGVAQTESKWRIARERSHYKRGPPFAESL